MLITVSLIKASNLWLKVYNIELPVSAQNRKKNAKTFFIVGICLK